MTAAINNTSSDLPIRGRNSSIASGDDNFLVGQMINIKVQQRLDEQHYVVVVRGESRKVTAAHTLPVGETIDAVVVRTEGQLELRQVGTDTSEISNRQVTGARATLESVTPADYSDMQAVATFYKCTFSPRELAMLQTAVDQSPMSEPVALAGILLNKRGVALKPELLQALSQLQSDGSESLAALAQSMAGAKTAATNETTVLQFAQQLRQMLAQGTSLSLPVQDEDLPVDALDGSDKQLIAELGSPKDELLATNLNTTSDGGGDSYSPGQLAQFLTDVDADGLGVRYGTLPVLIDGRLVELELMMFQHRPRDTDVEPVRRLVMSVNTSTLGTVQITAEALNQRLMIQISGESVEHAEVLSSYADEVRELTKQFGWALDSVGYEVRTQGGRLAQRVIEHSIRQGVVDHVW